MKTLLEPQFEPRTTLPAVPTQNATPQKPAIVPARERLQTELMVGGWLVTVLPPALLLLWVQAGISWQSGTLISSMAMHGVYFSIVLAVAVVVLRLATPVAALVGGVVCFTLTLTTTLTSSRLSQTSLPALFTLVVLTSAATRLGRAHKTALGLAESHRGRTTGQIVANLGVASAVALLHGMEAAALPACIAVLAEATADTVSSELGPLLRGRTVLLTTLRPVPPGTDGGISLGGTLCGIAGAAAVVAVAGITIPLTWLEVNIAFWAALAGFFADSLLGATLERRGLIGNNWVNFLSTGVAAVVAFPLGVWLIP